jgi:alkanesulfonate monooxygenase
MSYLWYIPNQVEPGQRGDDTGESAGWGTLGHSTDLARTAETHGWEGALLGTGWGRPDTFTLAATLAARTTTFKPLIAVRPGYWQPAHFASSAATLDHLSGGRVLVNIVSGLDNLAAYGDHHTDPANRYERTREFLHLVRRLWTEEHVTYRASTSPSRTPPWFRTPPVTPTGTPPSTSAARPSPRSGWPPPRRTCSCSGASRWRAWPSASSV